MITISSVYLLTIFLSDITSKTRAVEWSYKNEETWAAVCHKGTEQSPINLSPDISQEVNYPPFKFIEYDRNYQAVIKNNGHALEVRLYNSSKPSVRGGGLPSVYYLDHFHFHWNSEHTVEDNRYPLELHLVHYDARTRSVSEALKYRGNVVVLSVLFYQSPDDDLELGTLFRLVNRLQSHKVGEFEQINDIYLNHLLPRDRVGFYRYNGSLTTPDCTEGVIWTVFTNALPISRYQLDAFSTLRTLDGDFLTKNYRSMQELNDRPVFLRSSDQFNCGSNIGAKTLLAVTLLASLICTL